MEPVKYLSWSFLETNVNDLEPKAISAKNSTLEV